MKRRHWLATASLLLTTAQADTPDADISVMMEELHPYSYLNSQGRPAGYAVEIARELLKRAELEGRFEFSSWPRVLAKGRSTPAVLLPAIVRLPEREQDFAWLGSIAKRYGMLYRRKTRSDVNPSNLEEVRRYRTAVVIGDASERELLTLGLDANRHLDRSTDYAIALRRFFSNRADLLAISRSLAPTVLKQHGYNFQALQPVMPLSESIPSMALSLPTDAATRLKLQQAFDAMRREGRLAEIASRYPTISLD